MSHVQADLVEILESCFVWWVVKSLDPALMGRWGEVSGGNGKRNRSLFEVEGREKERRAGPNQGCVVYERIYVAVIQ